MNYRVTSRELLETLEAWDAVLPGRGKIRMIACGGTAMTLLGYKESTKDVDFLIPDTQDYERLIRFLKAAGYQPASGHSWKRPGEVLVFDLFLGDRVYQTDLLSSPLRKGGHRKIREWKKIYLGVLNPPDLIITKLFRGDQVDFDDCYVVVQKEKPDLRKLEKRYRETASYYPNEGKVLKHWDWFLRDIKK